MKKIIIGFDAFNKHPDKPLRPGKNSAVRKLSPFLKMLLLHGAFISTLMMVINLRLRLLIFRICNVLPTWIHYFKYSEEIWLLLRILFRIL